MSAFATRFAPSPTGRLHLGHAYSALSAYDAARAAGGRFVLRIEDIDRIRARPEFDASILEDLAWLGLAWETPVRRQSEHMHDYAAALARLRDMGVLYRCFRTRREVLDEVARAPHAGDADPQAFTGAALSPAAEGERLATERDTAMLGGCRSPQRGRRSAGSTACASWRKGRGRMVSAARSEQGRPPRAT